MVFELTVKDQNGYESKPSQTYITAFLDDKVPLIEGSNSSKNTATFTFTDTGQGIDDDGITFIEDNRGSGVAAYWITNDESVMPTEDDWSILMKSPTRLLLIIRSMTRSPLSCG